MKLYVAFCQDRHTDPVIRVFTRPEKAVEFAREFMRDNMAHPEGITERELPDGMISISYEYESDHAYTEVVTLNDDGY